MDNYKISRRQILSAAGGALAAGRAPGILSGQNRRDRPNFIYIYTDDQRWDAIRKFGRQPWLRTPNMDRLATEGVNFSNSFVTISLCSPSRSCLLSGLYPHKTGVTDNRVLLRDDVVLAAARLREAGYSTGYVGKVHMRNFWEKDRGFDYYASFPGQGSYFNNRFIVNGKVTPTEGYITDHINKYALDFLEQRDPGRPFALYVGHKAVHGNFQPDPQYEELFSGVYVGLPKTWDDLYEGRPPYLKQRRKSWHGIEGMLERLPKMGIRNYSELQRRLAACLVSVDNGLGQILQRLEKTGDLDNTIIMYSSDNGYFRGEHGLNDKRAMYEDSIRIPLLVRYPRLAKRGGTLEQMVLQLDIAPTMLDFAGVDIPRELQGRSWKPALEGRDPGGRDDWLYEYFWEKSFPFDPTQYGIRTKRYKYIRYPDVGNTDPEYPMPKQLPYDELYDLQSDPLEMRNIASDPAASSVLASMKDLLKKRLEETEYPGGFR